MIINCEKNKYGTYREYLRSISNLYDRYKREECSNFYDSYINRCEEYFVNEENYSPLILI